MQFLGIIQFPYPLLASVLVTVDGSLVLAVVLLSLVLVYLASKGSKSNYRKTSKAADVKQAIRFAG